MAARGRKSKIDQIWPNKSHFGSAFGYHSSDFNKICHEHTSWPYKQVCAIIYQIGQNWRWPPEVKCPKSTKFDPTNHISARHLVPVHQIWIEVCMDILLDLKPSLRINFSFIAKFKMATMGQRSKIDQIWPHKSYFRSAFGSHSSDLDKIWHEHTSWQYKQVCARIYQLVQNRRWLPPEVKGQK